MIYLKTRMVSLVLAFGIFFTLSCTVFDRTSDSSSNATNTQQQLEEVNQRLSDNPDDLDLQQQKGELLVQLAFEREHPSQRTPLYRNFKDLYSEQSADQERFDDWESLKTKAWTEEQSTGVRILQQGQSDLEAVDTDLIATHFENAILLNPDSVSTYNLLSNLYYRTGQLSKAISTLEEAYSISDEDEPSILEKLAYLNLESGNIEESIEMYSELVRSNPSGQVLNGLANAYMLNQQHSEAIEILRDLTEQYPTRYEYSEALAAQLYYVVANQLTSATDQSLTAEQSDELFSKIDEIDSIFDSLSDNLPLSEEQMVRSGAFYKNTASLLSKLSSFDNENIQNRVESKYITLLEKGMPVWESLFESNPENLLYIDALYEIYIELDMDEEAEALQRSSNF